MALDLFEMKMRQDELLQVSHLAKHCCLTTYMNGDVNVIVVSRVHVNGMEASARTVDDLQPLALLHCQVDQDRPVWQVCKRLVKRCGRGFGSRK